MADLVSRLAGAVAARRSRADARLRQAYARGPPVATIPGRGVIDMADLAAGAVDSGCPDVCLPAVARRVVFQLPCIIMYMALAYAV